MAGSGFMAQIESPGTGAASKRFRPYFIAHIWKSIGEEFLVCKEILKKRKVMKNGSSDMWKCVDVFAYEGY